MQLRDRNCRVCSTWNIRAPTGPALSNIRPCLKDRLLCASSSACALDVVPRGTFQGCLDQPNVPRRTFPSLPSRKLTHCSRPAWTSDAAMMTPFFRTVGPCYEMPGKSLPGHRVPRGTPDCYRIRAGYSPAQLIDLMLAQCRIVALASSLYAAVPSCMRPHCPRARRISVNIS